MDRKASVRQLLSKIKGVALMPNAHQAFRPTMAPVLSYEDIMLRSPRFAAVNLMLYQKDGEWHFPLIVRKRYRQDKHSGEIALPGGQKEQLDASFAETALREAHEEVGIDRRDIRIIREMSPVYVPPSNFYVYPFISYTRRNPAFYLQESEVEDFIECRVANLLSLREQPEMTALPTTGGIEVPVMSLNGHTIWGATSMILSEFRQMLQGM